MNGDQCKGNINKKSVCMNTITTMIIDIMSIHFLGINTEHVAWEGGKATF